MMKFLFIIKVSTIICQELPLFTYNDMSISLALKPIIKSVGQSIVPKRDNQDWDVFFEEIPGNGKAQAYEYFCKYNKNDDASRDKFDLELNIERNLVVVPNSCFSAIKIPKNIAEIPKHSKLNLFDPEFDKWANMDTTHEGIWQTVVLDFKDSKNWPNVSMDSSLQVKLKVFLFNFEDSPEHDSIFTNQDGFLGISPC